MPHIVPLLLLALALVTGPDRADAAGPPDPWTLCARAVGDAERAAGIPEHLLQAIALAESGRTSKAHRARLAWPWTVMAERRGRYLPSKAAAIAEVKDLQAREQDGRILAEDDQGERDRSKGIFEFLDGVLGAVNPDGDPVVVLANRNGTMATTALALSLWDRLLGLEDLAALAAQGKTRPHFVGLFETGVHFSEPLEGFGIHMEFFGGLADELVSVVTEDLFGGPIGVDDLSSFARRVDHEYRIAECFEGALEKREIARVFCSLVEQIGDTFHESVFDFVAGARLAVLVFDRHVAAVADLFRPERQGRVVGVLQRDGEL